MDAAGSNYTKGRIPRLNSKGSPHSYQIMSQLLSSTLETADLDTRVSAGESARVGSSGRRSQTPVFSYLPPVDSDSIARSGVSSIHLSVSSANRDQFAAPSSYSSSLYTSPGPSSRTASSRFPTTLIKFRNENDVTTTSAKTSYPSFTRIVSPAHVHAPLQTSVYSLNTDEPIDTNILNDKGELKSSKEIIYTTKRVKHLNKPGFSCSGKKIGSHGCKTNSTVVDEPSAAFINATVLSSPYIFQANGSSLIRANQIAGSGSKVVQDTSSLISPVAQSHSQVVLNRSNVLVGQYSTPGHQSGAFGSQLPKESSQHGTQSGLEMIGGYELDCVTGQFTYTYPVNDSSSATLQEIAAVGFSNEQSKTSNGSRHEAEKDLASRFISDSVNSQAGQPESGLFHVTDSFINDLNNPIKSASTNQFIDLFNSNNESVSVNVVPTVSTLNGSETSNPASTAMELEPAFLNESIQKNSNKTAGSESLTVAAEELPDKSNQSIKEESESESVVEDFEAYDGVKHSLFSLADSNSISDLKEICQDRDEKRQVRVGGYTLSFPENCEADLMSMFNCYVALSKLEDEADINDQLGIKLVCSQCQKRFPTVNELHEHKHSDHLCNSKAKQRPCLSSEAAVKPIRKKLKSGYVKSTRPSCTKPSSESKSTPPLAKNNIDYYLMTYTYDGSESVDEDTSGKNLTRLAQDEAEYLYSLASGPEERARQVQSQYSSSACTSKSNGVDFQEPPSETQPKTRQQEDLECFDLEKSLISEESKSFVSKYLLDWGIDNGGEDRTSLAKKPRAKSTSEHAVKTYQLRKRNKVDLSEQTTPGDDSAEAESLEESEEFDSALDSEDDYGSSDNEDARSDLETVNPSKSKQSAKPRETATTKKKRRPRQVERYKGIEECEKCKKSCRTKAELLVHQHKHAGKSPECWECGKKCASFSNLISHVQIHTGEKPYSCSTCGKQFTQDAHLQRHMRLHTGERPFVCSICGKDYKDYSYYRTHMRIHRGERLYKCEYCGKEYYDASYYKKHIRLHTGEKPYMCTVCGRQFHRSDYLKIHSYSHTKERPYTCQHCGRGFTMNYTLQIHLRRHAKPPKVKSKTKSKNKKYVLTTVTIEDNFDDFDYTGASAFGLLERNIESLRGVQRAVNEVGGDQDHNNNNVMDAKSSGNFDCMISVPILGVDAANEQILKQFEAVTASTNLAEFNLNEIL